MKTSTTIIALSVLALTGCQGTLSPAFKVDKIGPIQLGDNSLHCDQIKSQLEKMTASDANYSGNGSNLQMDSALVGSAVQAATMAAATRAASQSILQALPFASGIFSLARGAYNQSQANSQAQMFQANASAIARKQHLAILYNEKGCT